MKDKVCGKRRWNSWDEAALALVDAKIKQMNFPYHTRRREQRIYWCGACESHHLTSQPDRVST